MVGNQVCIPSKNIFIKQQYNQPEIFREIYFFAGSKKCGPLPCG
jgi:hypothetical protein